MSTMISRNVEDIPESSRQGIERLLGTSLQAHQRVYIVVDAPPAGPDQSVRSLAAKRIADLIACAQANTDLNDQEITEAVEEAMQAVRPRR